MIRYGIALCAVGFLASCQGSKIPVIAQEDFPHSEKPTAEEITFDGNRYDKFYIVDSVMLAYNAFSEDVFMDAYKLPSLDRLGVVARKGRADNEFLHVEYTDNNYYYENNELKILVYDQLRRSAHVINLSQTIARQKTIVEKNVRFDEEISNILLMDSNTILIRKDIFKNGNGCLYDLGSGECKDIGAVFGKFDAGHPDAYRSRMAVFPDDRHKIVFHYCTRNLISVRRVSEPGRGSTLEGPFSIFTRPLRPGRIFPETARLIYNDICVVGNEVYGLYMDQTMDDIIHTPRPVEIHRFDEDLRPAARYLVDEHIRFMAVDGADNVIYGVAADDRYYKYEL